MNKFRIRVSGCMPSTAGAKEFCHPGNPEPDNPVRQQAPGQPGPEPLPTYFSYKQRYL